MPIVSISKIASLLLVSVAEQAGLSLTWSQTPKTGFLVMITCIWSTDSSGYLHQYWKNAYGLDRCQGRGNTAPHPNGNIFILSMYVYLQVSFIHCHPQDLYTRDGSTGVYKLSTPSSWTYVTIFGTRHRKYKSQKKRLLVEILRCFESLTFLHQKLYFGSHSNYRCSHASFQRIRKNCKPTKWWFIMSPPIGLGDILFLPWSSVHLSVTKSCPLCDSKTIWEIFMKLYTNVKLHETTCRVQEP